MLKPKEKKRKWGRLAAVGVPVLALSVGAVFSLTESEVTAPQPSPSKVEASPQSAVAFTPSTSAAFSAKVAVPRCSGFLKSCAPSPSIRARLEIVGGAMEERVRDSFKACVDEALDSPLYHCMKDREPHVRLGVLAALVRQNWLGAEKAAVENLRGEKRFAERMMKRAGRRDSRKTAKWQRLAAVSGAALGEKEQAYEAKYMVLRTVFDALVAENPQAERLVDKVLAAKVSTGRARTSMAAAFGVLNTALARHYEEEGVPHPTRRVTGAYESMPKVVNVIPPAHSAEHVVVNVSSADLRKIADVCYQEAGVLDDPRGIRYCAATVFSRLSTGHFGSTTRQVLATGGFEPVDRWGGVDRVPAASSDVVKEVRAVAKGMIEPEAKKAVFFLSPEITRGRRSYFGAAPTWTSTVGNPDGTALVFYKGHMNQATGAVDVYDVPDYSVRVDGKGGHAPRHRGRAHNRRGYGRMVAL